MSSMDVMCLWKHLTPWHPNNAWPWVLNTVPCKCRLQRRPPGDLEYCARTAGRSPKETRWEFEDDTV
jgi:hypothetical protein